MRENPAKLSVGECPAPAPSLELVTGLVIIYVCVD